MSSPHPPSGQPRRPSYAFRLAFVFYFLAELALIYLLWTRLGPLWTITLFGATTLLGILGLGAIGTKAIRDYRQAVAGDRSPGSAAVSGTIGVVGAILLIMPGFLTDAVGLLCVFPPTRFLWRALVLRFLAKRVATTPDRLFGSRGFGRGRGGRDDEVIDGEVVDDAVGADGQTAQHDGPRRLSDGRDPSGSA